MTQTVLHNPKHQAPIINNNISSNRWLENSFVGAIFLAGILLRVYQLPSQIIADDEWHALYRAMIVNYSHIATHFGYADYSIPLTLYYKILSETVGLSEISMRLPSLIAGIFTPIVIPLLWRKHLDRNSYLFFVVMLTVSPLLIYFSRIARPYAITMLLSSTALVAAYRWWYELHNRWAIVYIFCTALAAYFHLASLLFTLVPVLICGSHAIGSALVGDKVLLLRIIYLSFFLLAALAVVVGPPLYVDHVEFMSKGGVQSVKSHSLAGAVHLWAGTGNHLLLLVLMFVGLIGLTTMWNTDRTWFAWCAICSVIMFISVVVSRSAGIDEAIVLARYAIPIVPVLLMVIANGASRIFQLAQEGMGRYFASIVLGVGLFFMGPLPDQTYYPNQFTGHMYFQSEYRFHANPYRYLRPHQIPEFYLTLSQLQPASINIVVAPWRYEWHRVNQNFYQEKHRQNIKIGFLGNLCGNDWRGYTGEYPVEARGLSFMNFVHLGEVISGDDEWGDYVVFHNGPPNAYDQTSEALYCIDIFRDRYGDPLFEDSDITVFSLR
jgi:hypothetical protein